MPTTRSYKDRCPTARALDAVGERWALLIVRELLLSSQRFSDLRRALPGASTNMLTDRLRELETRGIVRRRVLPPPAGSSVYELTARGCALEPVLDALGAWGAAEPAPDRGSLSATSVLLFLRGSLRAGPATSAVTLELRLCDRIWTLRAGDGEIEIEPRPSDSADAAIRTDPDTLNALVFDPRALDAAVADGAAQTEGDVAALRLLLESAAVTARSFAGS